MQEAVAAPIAAWESFYVIIGSSAAALTGLMFVVIALIADTPARGTSSQSIAAFGTPNIVHFCVALLISATLSAPWHSLANADIALGACGIGGTIYTLIVLKRARRQQGYKPVLEDWLWHLIFPLLAYLSIMCAAILARRQAEPALFIVGGATLALVFIGIHNAWDTVTYIALDWLEKKQDKKD